MRAHLALLLEVAPGWLVRTDVGGAHGAVYRLSATLALGDARIRVAAAHAALQRP